MKIGYMKSLIVKLPKWNLRFSNNLKALGSKDNFQGSYEKSEAKRWSPSMIFCMLFSMLFLNKKSECVEEKKVKTQQKNQKFSVDIYELNKSQFLQLLANINEEGILIVFNKYAKKEKPLQFEKSIESVYKRCKQLGVGKIYLIERDDIRHLQTFERWLRGAPSPEDSNEQNSEIDSKGSYFYLSPDFPSNPFKIEEQQLIQQISQIRKHKINLNPSEMNTQILQPFQQTFNLTTVIKQCPNYCPSFLQNHCIEDYRKQIATLIEQGMLKNKADEYRFFALTPKTKKDTSTLINFHKLLRQSEQQAVGLGQSIAGKTEQSHRVENIFVLKNDLLGLEVQNMRTFNSRNYSMLKNLTPYEKFLLFIRPRVFIVSKINPSIDLYWYVTCLHKNKKASISINNTDSFNLGRKYPITDGFWYPQNWDLQFLRELYKNHPQLNYLIVNTEIVSELIRHLPVKRKYVIFDLTSDLSYPKMFLPHYYPAVSPTENYNLHFKPQIQKYLAHSKIYDQIVLDKQKKINSKQLRQMMQRQNENFVLRVCNSNCSQDISQDKLLKAFRKLQDAKQNGNKRNEDSGGKSRDIADVQQKNWQNGVFERTFWIDSAYNSVGLKDGDYLYCKGSYQKL